MLLNLIMDLNIFFNARIAVKVFRINHMILASAIIKINTDILVLAEREYMSLLNTNRTFSRIIRARDYNPAFLIDLFLKKNFKGIVFFLISL